LPHSSGGVAAAFGDGTKSVPAKWFQYEMFLLVLRKQFYDLPYFLQSVWRVAML
jgi:hypothetical protein